MISVTLRDDKLHLKIMGNNFKKNLNQIKSIEGAEFDEENKVWIIDRDKIDYLRKLAGDGDLAYNVPIESIKGQKIEKPNPLEGIDLDYGGLDGLDITIPHFQLQGINFLAQKKRAILADDMG